MFYGFPSPFLHSSYSVQSESHILSDVAQSIQGQYEAIHYYSKLATLAPDARDQEQILEIRADEVKHYHTFRQLYRSLTGKEPRVREGSLPKSFKEGVKYAIQDELKTVDFYLSISDKAKNPSIKEIYRRAALDEQQHASWFQFMWTKQIQKKCKCRG